MRNGVPGIVGECGGSLSCATCHVFVREDCLAQLDIVVPCDEAVLLEGVRHGNDRRGAADAFCVVDAIQELTV